MKRVVVMLMVVMVVLVLVLVLVLVALVVLVVSVCCVVVVWLCGVDALACYATSPTCCCKCCQEPVCTCESLIFVSFNKYCVDSTQKALASTSRRQHTSQQIHSKFTADSQQLHSAVCWQNICKT